jgi:hypothetical protein
MITKLEIEAKAGENPSKEQTRILSLFHEVPTHFFRSTLKGQRYFVNKF